jgi:C4-dicarboxylate-specific signal transduction histidine kinase
MASEPGTSDSDILLKSGLTFNGRITASVTHELNNVIGTIMQVVGLIEDLAMTEEVKQANLSDRMLSVVDRIEKQSDRGTALIKRLNTFAHMSDEDRAECDLGEFLTTMANLSERLIGLRKVTLRRTGLNRQIIVVTNQILLAQAVFGCIEAVLDVTSEGETIDVELAEADTGARIDVRSPFKGATGEIQPATAVQLIAARLGLRIDASSDDNGVRIRLAIPPKPETGSAG